MTGHSTHLVTNHSFTEQHFDYYRERARGGVGVITTEALTVHPTTQLYDGAIVFAGEEAVVENYRKLAAAVHEFDTLIFAQLWHAGRQTTGLVSRLPVWAPSAVPDPTNREMPHAMTIDEIDEIVRRYALAAKHAVAGGMDGVEIHGVTHGYLLGQFLSPATNHRTDEYGGSWENRLKLVLRILDTVRATVPSGFVVGMRISGLEGLEGGLDTEDWRRIARRLADTRQLDYLSVTQGTYQNRQLLIAATPESAGYQIPITRQIKEAVPELPVVAVGRISTPEMGEHIVESGAADMVGMARQLIADPEWVTKAAEGRPDDIRPCVGANWCMASVLRSKLACIHNPAVGRERTLGAGTLLAVGRPRQVAVVGAGPAGLRAALTAAQRGHEVTVYERADHVGGQVALLGGVEGVREYVSIIDWLHGQLAKTSAKLNLSSEASPGLLDGFDTVIVATGSVPLRSGWSSLRAARWSPAHPPIAGADQENVLTVNDVLSGADVYERVLIFDDTGSRQPLVAAEYLAAHGHPVHVVTSLGSVGPDLADTRDLPPVYRRLRRLGVTFAVHLEVLGIDEDAVQLRDLDTGEEFVHAPVDTLVLSTGNRAVDELAHALRTRRDPATVLTAGDCVAPRRIFNAIWEGELAGRAV